FQLFQTPIPLRILQLGWMFPDLDDLEVFPLPQRSAIVNIRGLVVSSRTQYPQLAYELAEYMAGDFAIVSAITYADISYARTQFADVETMPLYSEQPDAYIPI